MTEPVSGDNEQTPALPEDRQWTLEELTLSPPERARVEVRGALMATITAGLDGAVTGLLSDRGVERCADLIIREWLPRWLAGRTVLELPAPVRQDPSMWEAADGIEPYWRVDPDLDESGPLVRCQLGDRYMDSGDAFRLGLALIAGAREAERLASESSGDGA